MTAPAYTRTVRTPPAELAVSVDALKAHARIDTADEDATELPRLIRAATSAVEAECRGVAIVHRTIELLFNEQPDGWVGELVLPDKPVVEGSLEVGTYDTDSVWTAAAAEAYLLDPYGHRVLFADGTSDWPTIGTRAYAGLGLRYVAGYGADEGEVEVQCPGLHGAVLQLATYWYDHRDAEGSGNLPDGVLALLRPYVRYDLAGG